ncbi:MAG: hypothetical protein K1W16_04215 [Lachnospiraceae bacterium]
MLSDINLDDKGYDRIREEAIARISLYSKEWTNYNISDPGITILENFSAFMALQQSEINEIPEKIKLRLLALAGFTPKEGRCARAYLLPEHIETPYLPPACMKLHTQDICFELEQCAVIKEMRLLSVCVGDNNLILNQTNYQTALLSRYGVKGGVPLFGEQPTGGETVLLTLSDIPQAGQKVAFYIELAQQFARNPVESLNGKFYENPFAEVQWTIRTQKGNVPLPVEDGTYGFLQSGYVAFTIEEKLYRNLAKDFVENEYQIQVTLLRADYDIIPRIQRICGLLIPAVQRDTRSDVMVLPVENGKVCIRNSLLQKDYGGNGSFMVYAKEIDGVYHRYVPANQEGTMSKRLFELEYDDGDIVVLTLVECDGLRLGREAFVVCRDNTLMEHSNLGKLYGYDEQEFPLPDFGVVSIQDFSVLVVERNFDGDEFCHVVKPGNHTAAEVYYSVCEQEHKLIVHDCGQYEGAELYLGNFSFYKGDGGNIRAETRLIASRTDNNSQLEFLNNTDIDKTWNTSGSFAECFEQVRRRFVEDLTKSVTMVTEADCDQIFRRIPGLSISKIGVCPVPERNEIHIAVMPNSTVAFPRLSTVYQREINRYLECYRMLTTKIVLEQPVYVAIHVKGVVLVRKHSVYNKEQVAEMIKQTLIKLLDGVHSKMPFGSRIVFYELYHCLENMGCVEEIIELSVVPEHSQWAQRDGLDIQLKPNALCFPGDLQIESIG